MMTVFDACKQELCRLRLLQKYRNFSGDLKLKSNLSVLIGGLILLFAGAGHAQKTSELSANIQGSRTLETQEKANELFEAGEYERSFFIYRNELVPIGDKYAQYMVGYMYETGIGIERDIIRASGWYRLAAERGTPEFVAVQNQVTRTFSPEEIAASDALYRELLDEYSDLIVLLNRIKQDLRELRSRTGSRLGSNTGPVAVVEARTGAIRSAGVYFGSIERRVEEHLRKLVELGELEGVETDPDNVDLADIERKVREAMALRVEG